MKDFELVEEILKDWIRTLLELEKKEMCRKARKALEIIQDLKKDILDECERNKGKE